MKLKGIKNIIFDVGGVLLNIDFNLTKQAFINLGVTNFELYHTQAKQNGVFDLFETGKLTENEFCNQLKILTNITASNTEIINAWNAMLLDFPKAYKTLLINLKKEYNLSVLSNTNETHLRTFYQIIHNDIGETSLDNLFHSYYFSHEIGYRKPTKEAFEFVLRANKFIASETLFIDDTKEHIIAAKKLNLKTYFLQKSETITTLFNEY